jgi:xanthine dehydrogenase small subunit
MKGPIRYIINNRESESQSPPGSLTIDLIRTQLKLTGTKVGCNEGECGACTILLGEIKGTDLQYKAVASCLLPIGEIKGKHIVTIEGLDTGKLNPIQQAFLDEGASQCGYCTPGFIMSLTGYFLTSKTLDYQEAIDAMDGNLCRCTGYVSIQRAVEKLCREYQQPVDREKDTMAALVEWGILPRYFLEIFKRLETIKDAVQITEIFEKDREKEDQKKILVAGGTDLYVKDPQAMLEREPEFISQYKHLSFIREDKTEERIQIGAGTTVHDLKESEVIRQHFPKMKEYLNLVSSTIMRNRATIAGNIVNASPIGDLTIIFLALEAELHLNDRKKRRKVPLKDFYKGYKQMDLNKGEIIEEISMPIPKQGSYFHFEKVSRRRYLDIASANTSIYFTLDKEKKKISEIHISAGGVAPIPKYLKETVSFLKGKELKTEIIKKAAQIMMGEISPISDVRGTAEYKKLLLKNLLFAHFFTLLPEKIDLKELL